MVATSALTLIASNAIHPMTECSHPAAFIALMQQSQTPIGRSPRLEALTETAPCRIAPNHPPIDLPQPPNSSGHRPITSCLD